MRTVLKTLFGIVIVVALTLTVLIKGFGMHLVPYGSGIGRIRVMWYKTEDQYAAIEKHRAEQKAAPVPAAVVTAPVETPKADVLAAKAETAVVQTPAPQAAAPLYWTSFRGPHRDGVYDETKMLASWPTAGLPRLWKQPIGGGYASFVVAKGKAYTIEQRRDKEVVAAYEIATGHELWTQSWPGFFSETLGGDGPRATPTYDEGHVYALGAEGHFACLDAESGRVIWSHDILKENQATNLHWGMSGSPLIVDGKVIVQPGGTAGKSVVAYNKRTGAIVWKSLNDPQSYASPKLANVLGVRQIVMVSAARVAGLKIEDGSLLWDFPWVTSNDINSAEPVFIDDHRFFISSGYGHGGALVELVKNGDTFAAKQLWESKKLKTRFNAAVYHDGYFYGLDEGILACIDAANGDLKWKGGRYGYGQILLAGNKLIILSEDGDLALLKATPAKLDEISHFTAIEGKTWNYPAIDDGILLVRNTTEMAAFKIL